MAKKKTKFNSVFSTMFEFVTEHVNYDNNTPNGYKVKKKKDVKAACCHIMLKDNGNGDGSPEPKVMVEDDEVNNTSHCVICDRTFPTPDINIDNLAILKQAAGVINGALMLFPWSNITKSEARLVLECRNQLEQFIVMYESAVNDLSTVKVEDVDTKMKSHVNRL